MGIKYKSKKKDSAVASIIAALGVGLLSVILVTLAYLLGLAFGTTIVSIIVFLVNELLYIGFHVPLLGFTKTVIVGAVVTLAKSVLFSGGKA
jgi:hypothetical protein